MTEKMALTLSDPGKELSPTKLLVLGAAFIFASVSPALSVGPLSSGTWTNPEMYLLD